MSVIPYVFSGYLLFALALLSGDARGSQISSYRVTDGGVYIVPQNHWSSGFASGPMIGLSWAQAISSGDFLGKTSAAGYKDLIEDDQFNFRDQATGQMMYYNWTSNTFASYLVGATTWGGIAGQPQYGQSLVFDSSVIAQMDDFELLMDSDGTLSGYSHATRSFVIDLTWTTFSGGSLAGQTLTSQLSRLVGAEDAGLYFLENDGSLISYNYATGSLLSNPTWTTFTGGTLAGQTLTSALNSGTYMGIAAGPSLLFNSEPVPEPSSLMLGALSMFGLLKRKRASANGRQHRA